MFTHRSNPTHTPRPSALMRSQTSPWSVPGMALLFALLVATGSPAQAEVLVLRSGETLEVKGSWQQRGSRIVYTAADGSLLSIRASEVDLEATQARAEQAAEPAADPVDPESSAQPQHAASRSNARPVVTITNRDVGGAQRKAQPTQSDGLSEAPAAAAAAPQGALQLIVTEWSDQLGVGAGLVISGTLSNQGDSTGVNVRVTAELIDSDGRAVDISTASLDGVRLEPGDRSPFEVRFPSAVAFETVRFDVTAVPLLRRAPDTVEDTEAADGSLGAEDGSVGAEDGSVGADSGGVSALSEPPPSVPEPAP
jgi:hypothetical protein